MRHILPSLKTRSANKAGWSLRRLIPLGFAAGVLATVVLPVFVMQAGAAPLSIIDMFKRGYAWNQNGPANESIPFRSCTAKLENRQRDINLLNTYFSNNAGTWRNQPIGQNPANERPTYIGNYYGPRNPNKSNTSLTEAQYNFIMNEPRIGVDQLPVIQFAAAGAGTPINGPLQVNGDDFCSGLVMLPVSHTEWRGYQWRDLGSLGSPPYRYMTFTIDPGEADPNKGVPLESTGTLKYWSIENERFIRERTDHITIYGDPLFDQAAGGGIGTATFTAEWTNASEMKISSWQGSAGTPNHTGEVYRMGKWQAMNGKSYYFLHGGVPDNSPRATLLDSNGKLCQNEPGPLPPGRNCTGGADSGVPNCVPFIELDRSVAFDTNNPGSFQGQVNNLGSAHGKLYDYNSDCQQNSSADLTQLSYPNRAETWFYYSKQNDSFALVFTEGKTNENNYLGIYNKDASGVYIGGAHGCDGYIRILDAANLNNDLFTVEWQLRNVSQNSATCQAPTTYATPRVQVAGGAAGEAKYQEISGIITDVGNIGDTGNLLNLNCDVTFNPLTWIMCPIIAGAQAGVEQFDNAINRLLEIDVDKYLDENCTTGTSAGVSGCAGPKLYKVWSSLRVLATGLIVIAALIMVISQALGAELLSAYQFKKIIPVTVIVLILMPASWELSKDAIRMSDVIGLGVRNLIYTAFGSGSAINIGEGASSALALIGGGILLGLGLFATLSFAVTAFLASLVAMGVLLFREFFVLAFATISAFTLALYIMPFTRPAAKVVLDNGIKLIIVFPLLAHGIIAGGRGFAYILAATGDLFGQVTAVIFYFGSEAAIIMVPAWSGSAISAISGLGKNIGLFGALRNFRGNALKGNLAKMGRGDRFRGSNALSRAFNRTTQGVSSGWEGRFGLGRRGAAMRDIKSRAAATAAGKSERMQEVQFDDDAIAALYLSAGQSSRRAARELRRLNPGWSNDRVQRAVAMAEYAGINNSNAIAAGSLAADNKFRSMGAGQAASDAIAATNAVIAGGGLDNGGNYVGGNQQLFNNLEGGIRWHARTHGATHVADRTLAGSWDRANMQELNASTPGATRAFAEDIRTRLGSSNGAVRQRAARQALELHTVLSQGTDAGSQEALLQFESRIGFDGRNPDPAGAVPRGTTTWRQERSFEEYLGQNVLGQGQGYGVVLRSQARTWDSQDAETARLFGRGGP